MNNYTVANVTDSNANRTRVHSNLAENHTENSS